MNIILNEVKNGKIVIEVFGQIGSSFFEDGFTVSSLRDQLAGLEFDTIELQIQSMGGSAYEAVNIYELLNFYKGKGVKIITMGIGLVASSAATILAAGGDRIMSNTGMLLVHKASGAVAGKEEDLEEALENIERINNNILDIYSQVTGRSKEELSDLLDEDRWMDAKEAKKWGFLTKVSKAKKMTNDIDMMELVNKVNESNLPKIKVEKNKTYDMINEEMYNELVSLCNLEEGADLIEVLKSKFDELENVNNVVIERDATIVNLTTSNTEKDESITNLTEKSTELENTIDGLNKGIKDKEINDLLDSAIKQHRIDSSEKDDFIKLFNLSFDDTKSLLGKRKAVTPKNILENAVVVEEVITDERKEWDILDWQKNDPDGLKEMSINNSEIYNELYNSEYEKY